MSSPLHQAQDSDLPDSSLERVWWGIEMALWLLLQFYDPQILCTAQPQCSMMGDISVGRWVEHPSDCHLSPLFAVSFLYVRLSEIWWHLWNDLLGEGVAGAKVVGFFLLGGLLGSFTMIAPSSGRASNCAWRAEIWALISSCFFRALSVRDVEDSIKCNEIQMRHALLLVMDSHQSSGIVWWEHPSYSHIKPIREFKLRW